MSHPPPPSLPSQLDTPSSLSLSKIWEFGQPINVRMHIRQAAKPQRVGMDGVRCGRLPRLAGPWLGLGQCAPSADPTSIPSAAPKARPAWQPAHRPQFPGPERTSHLRLTGRCLLWTLVSRSLLVHTNIFHLVSADGIGELADSIPSQNKMR
jgi:hypothetical protein